MSRSRRALRELYHPAHRRLLPTRQHKPLLPVHPAEQQRYPTRVTERAGHSVELCATIRLLRLPLSQQW